MDSAIEIVLRALKVALEEDTKEIPDFDGLSTDAIIEMERAHEQFVTDIEAFAWFLREHNLIDGDQYMEISDLSVEAL